MALALILWIVVFIVSLAVLVKAADYFTNHSEKIGLIVGISPFIIGVTIVSIGTSLPELATSIASVLQGETQLVVDNVLGSNIANILLIVGVCAIAARRLVMERELIDLDGPLLLAGTALFALLAYDGSITFVDAIILLGGYGAYLGYTILARKDEDHGKKKVNKKGLWKSIVIVVVSATAVAVGAKFTIDAVLNISTILNIGSSLIALTAVAVGTSLPELLVSVKAAIHKKYEIALGNIFGSNLFNVLAVTGVPGLIHTLDISQPTIAIALPYVGIATLLFVVSGISKRIHNWEGIFFLLIYAVFVGKLFNLL